MVKNTPNQTKNAVDYNDLSLFEGFAEDVKKEHEEQQSNDNTEPLFFPDVNHRTYRLRFHPLIKFDPEAGKNKLVLTRIVFSHSGFEKTRRLPCAGTGCPICKETKRLRDAKHPDAWRYSSKREALVPAYIYESNVPKDYKYIRHNEYGYMILRNKAYNSLNAFLDNLTPEEMRSVLNPKVEAHRLMFTVSPGSEGSSSWSFDLKKAELPEMPSDFPDMDISYVDFNKPVTEEELKTVRSTVNKLLATNGGVLSEPPETQPQAPTSAPDAAAAVGAALGDSAPASSPAPQKQQSAPNCPGTAEGLSWGNNPQELSGDVRVSCMSCPFEDQCIEVTRSNKGG